MLNPLVFAMIAKLGSDPYSQISKMPFYVSEWHGKGLKLNSHDDREISEIRGFL